MIIKPERKKGRLIIVTDSEEYDLTLYASTPQYFYVADHADEYIDYLDTELSGCRDEITRLQAERDAMREQLRAVYSWAGNLSLTHPHIVPKEYAATLQDKGDDV